MFLCKIKEPEGNREDINNLPISSLDTNSDNNNNKLPLMIHLFLVKLKGGFNRN